MSLAWIAWLSIAGSVGLLAVLAGVCMRPNDRRIPYPPSEKCRRGGTEAVP